MGPNFGSRISRGWCQPHDRGGPFLESSTLWVCAWLVDGRVRPVLLASRRPAAHDHAPTQIMHTTPSAPISNGGGMLFMYGTSTVNCGVSICCDEIHDAGGISNKYTKLQSRLYGQQ